MSWMRLHTMNIEEAVTNASKLTNDLGFNSIEEALNYLQKNMQSNEIQIATWIQVDYYKNKSGKNKKIGFILSEKLVNQIELFSRAHDTNKSRAVRYLLERSLKDIKAQNKIKDFSKVKGSARQLLHLR